MAIGQSPSTPMRPFFFAGLCGLALLIIACSRPPSRAAETPPLLLISIDGFRHDYLDLAETPALDRLVQGGFKADSLHHVFPTKTFPTHYSIVTGRHPGTHGVVANSMWDPIRDDRFSLGNREAVMDGYWYEGGEPIWVTAEKQGLTAAAFFWPGTEARIHRVRPSYWKPYNARTPYQERVEQVLEWMDLPEGQRPDLVTMYFSSVDSAGHRDGPRSEATAAALADIDGHLLDLLNGLDARGLLDSMHIIVTSDHGMSRVDIDQYILLDEYLDLSRLRVSDWGPAGQIWAGEMTAEEIVEALQGAHPQMRVWRRADIPERLHFGGHHRVPDVLALADLEWMISNTPYMIGRTRFSLMGMHGWDPSYHEMHGLLIAHGPAFAPGTRSPSLRSIDLYALMTHLLAIEPAWHEGSLKPFEAYLGRQTGQRYEAWNLACPGQSPARALVGPDHLALHWGPQVFVLLRQASESGEAFEATGLRLHRDGESAMLRIDGQDHADCLTSPAAT
jgi:predicted AlkP superfamily pyrophosphatase or phosphodiesterase